MVWPLGFKFSSILETLCSCKQVFNQALDFNKNIINDTCAPVSRGTIVLIPLILQLRRHFSLINWTTLSLSDGTNVVLWTPALSIFSFLLVTNWLMALQRTWCWFYPFKWKFLLQLCTDWQPPQTLNLSCLFSFTKTNSRVSSQVSHYKSYCDYLQRYFLPCLLYLHSENLRGYCFFMVYEGSFYINLVFFIYT